MRDDEPYGLSLIFSSCPFNLPPPAAAVDTSSSTENLWMAMRWRRRGGQGGGVHISCDLITHRAITSAGTVETRRLCEGSQWRIRDVTLRRRAAGGALLRTFPPQGLVFGFQTGLPGLPGLPGLTPDLSRQRRRGCIDAHRRCQR